MIEKDNQEYNYKPIEMCPSFNRCNNNLCPLDPYINDRPYVNEGTKCVATKPTRMNIAEQFAELLPYKGLTNREWSGQLTWARRDPKEKKKFVESNTKRLKKMKKD